MDEVPDMTDVAIDEVERLAQAVSVVNHAIDIVFDHAPVMMHSIGRDGRMIQVNRRWLQTLGFEVAEVLGKKSTEFLTEQSRDRAVNETLPLFWRAGSARSVGYRYISKDSSVLALLLSAEVMLLSAGILCSYATLYNVDDPTQWEQASATMGILRQLTHIRHILDGFLPGNRELPPVQVERYLNLFGTEGAPIDRLLRQAASDGFRPTDISKLLLMFSVELRNFPAATWPALSPAQPIIEPLTERELFILRLIHVGLGHVP